MKEQTNFQKKLQSTMKIHKSTVCKDIENKLEVYSIDEIIVACREVLKDLKKYGDEFEFPIQYYTMFWNLLIEYL